MAYLLILNSYQEFFKKTMILTNPYRYEKSEKGEAMMGPKGGWVNDENMGLLVDLYELTMAQSYFRRGKNELTTFELFVRNFPPNRSYLIACGLEQAVYYLLNLRFTPEVIEYLKSLGLFSEDFLKYLSNFRFTGSVWALPEGEVFFPKEPILRVTAPRIEAQIVETFLLNTINFQCMIATKASRVVLAAEGRSVIDFSARRVHGADAALKVARASYVGGCSGTSCTLAGMIYGIPVYGTMAHSYVMSFPNELEAFCAFAEDFPDNVLLLIDTYDTIRGAENAVKVAKVLERRGYRLKGVRIDSGDLVELSKKVREILDANGLHYVKILLSGDLNEYRISELLKKGAKADLFGVGTELGTSYDAPALGGIYKLVQDETGPRIKLSSGKLTYPGKKQIWRIYGKDGLLQKDIIALEGEGIREEGECIPLLVRIIENGELKKELPSLESIRQRCLNALKSLPPPLKVLKSEASPPLEISPALKALTESLIESYSIPPPPGGISSCQP
jgi:nicotinate phosphoribosyltransferase